jgi:hypothetical protein
MICPLFLPAKKGRNFWVPDEKATIRPSPFAYADAPPGKKCEEEKGWLPASLPAEMVPRPKDFSREGI